MMRLKQEVMDEALRRMAEQSLRRAKIQAVFEAVAPALSAKLNTDLHPQKYGKRRWERAALKAIYGSDSLTL